MSVGVSIRRATLGDAQALAELGAVTFTETFGHLYKNEDLQAFLKKNHSPQAYEEILADPAWAVWIAEAPDGEKMGYAAAGPCGLPVPEMPEKSGELVRLYLLRAHQKSGVGGHMLATALDWLEKNFDHLYLSVYAENYGAQRLYQRHGFVKIHDYFYKVGEHSDPEWIMQRKIDR
ncbi:MAG: GNAT family N-acetyltransferase [Parvularculaceae bacterium]